MSGQTANPDERREIEEIWEYIVDERKIAGKTLLGIPMD